MAHISLLFAPFIWILIASCCPMATEQLGAAQANKPSPADIRIDHDVDTEEARMLNIFLSLLHNTGLHGGLVEIAGCSKLPQGRLHIKSGVTVRQAMDALVAANPGYKWELKGGVVNLMPRGDALLLRARVAKFQKDATDREIEAVLNDVLRLPDVQRREGLLGLKLGMSGGGLSGMEEHPVPRQPIPVHFNLENLSLQDAFNKIVQGSPKGVWIYRETDCSGAKTFIVEVASDY